MTSATKTAALVLVELKATDPEASSALMVARARLACGQGLVSLRRLRVFELLGELPAREEIKARLHRSTQFYNPSKERCHLLTADDGRSPFTADESVVLVFERGGERRPAAERWWRHDGGERIDVREGVAWGLRYEDGVVEGGRVEALALTTSRDGGLLCNPHAQQCRVLVAGDAPPLDWISRKNAARLKRAGGGNAS